MATVARWVATSGRRAICRKATSPVCTVLYTVKCHKTLQVTISLSVGSMHEKREREKGRNVWLALLRWQPCSVQRDAAHGAAAESIAYKVCTVRTVLCTIHRVMVARNEDGWRESRQHSRRVARASPTCAYA